MNGVAPREEPGDGDAVASLVRAVSDGRRRPVDVVAEHVERCRDSHARLNALVQPRFEEALREAATCPPGGALLGLPVSVKECFAVRGLATTLGIVSRRGERDGHDAEIVARLRAAGAVVLGKSNVPQAMYLHETDNPVWGRTVHPTRPDRGPGGSSGGDAALVADGCVPLAIGNDLAGSIRQPAHACGIVGFLPRRASLGGGGAFETMPGLAGERSRVGFLVRRVDDAEVALRALVPPAATPPASPAEPRSLRIGWWDECGPLGAGPAVRRAVAEAVDRLRRSGASVERLDHRVAEEAAWIHLGFVSADGGRDIRRLFRGERPMAQVRRLLGIAATPAWARRILAGACAWGGRRLEARALERTGPRGPRGLAALVDHRAAIDSVVEGWRARYDAVVCPVSALPALRHGTASRLVLAAAPCLLANLVDLAAGTVPVTRVAPGEERHADRGGDPIERLASEAEVDSVGLPVGVQVVSLHRAPGIAESVLLAVMRGVESPPISP